MIVMDIAEYARLIKDERQRQGISQTDMAQRLGVSRRWLIEFEHARVPNPGFSTILSALTELGLALDVRKTPQPAELYEWGHHERKHSQCISRRNTHRPVSKNKRWQHYFPISRFLSLVAITHTNIAFHAHYRSRIFRRHPA